MIEVEKDECNMMMCIIAGRDVKKRDLKSYKYVVSSVFGMWR
jgi:hypothetical protein